MLRQCVGRVIVLAIIAGIGIGCSSNPPFSPTPASPPPTASPAPAPLTLALRSVSPSSGPTIGNDLISVSGVGFQPGATVTLDGLTAHVTRVTDTTIAARTPAHEAGTVDVVVTNPDGQTQRLPASYAFATFSVAASPNAAAPGEALTVTWAAPPGRGCAGGGDWIAIYRVGDPDNTGAANGHSDLWYDHVCGAVSGSWRVPAPAVPGEYEFRFLVGDTSVARSDRVTVREPAAVY
jgi:hypothetical protein